MPSESPQEPRDAETDGGRGGGRGASASYYRYAAVGLQFALTFLVCGALGWWLDGRFGTSPWLMVVGIALGAAGAFTSLLRQVPPARGSSRPRGGRPSR